VPTGARAWRVYTGGEWVDAEVTAREVAQRVLARNAACLVSIDERAYTSIDCFGTRIRISRNRFRYHKHRVIARCTTMNSCSPAAQLVHRLIAASSALRAATTHLLAPAAEHTGLHLLR
jgi:hypothetical protein